MPIPKPRKGERQSEYIPRCMRWMYENESDRPREQMLAICFDTWRRVKEGGGSKMSAIESRIACFMPRKSFVHIAYLKGGADAVLSVWQKEVLRYGSWVHPQNRESRFEINKDLVAKIIENFSRGYPKEIPVVLTHSDHPLDKVGIVKRLIQTENGLEAVLVIENSEVEKRLTSDELAPGVSCWIDFKYLDKETGNEVGPALLHVALVNHPYLEGLSPFKKVSLSEDLKDFTAVVLGEENQEKKEDEKMELTKEIAFKFLAEQGIDVEELLSAQKELLELHDRIDKGELVSLSDARAEILGTEVLKEARNRLALSDDVTFEDLMSKLLARLDELEDELKRTKEQLTTVEAEKTVGEMVASGLILPAEKDVFTEMYKKDQVLFSKFIDARRKEGMRFVRLGEKGSFTVQVESEEDKNIEKKLQELLERNIAAAKKEGFIRE